MKRVLIVAYYFPPIAVSGSMRPLGFCRYLEQFGWIPQILTTEVESVYPPEAVDQSLLGQVPLTVHVTRVGHANPAQNVLHLRYALRRTFQTIGRRGSGILANEGNTRIATQHSLFNRWMTIMKNRLWDRLFLFPDPQRYWLRPAEHLMSKLARQDYPDVVLATGSPWTGLLVGRELAKKFGVPFVADFRDPWFANPGRRVFSSRLSQKEQKLERSVLLSAAKVITNTTELCNQFQKTHPDLIEKFITISNGFDDNSHLSSKIAQKRELVFPQEKKNAFGLDLYHFGTVYGGRDPFPLLMAMKELFEEKQISSEQIRIHFIGNWDICDSTSEHVARDLESHGLLVRGPFIPHDECLAQMARADALLILQPNYPLQIPGKLYEYLFFRRPMLIVGGEGATSALVKRHRLGHCCPNEVLPLKAILFSLVENPDFIDPPPDTVIDGFHYRSLTCQLAGVLNVVSQKDS